MVGIVMVLLISGCDNVYESCRNDCIKEQYDCKYQLILFKNGQWHCGNNTYEEVKEICYNECK